MAAGEIHQSVLLAESLSLVDAGKGGLFIDATLGLGGHAEGLLESSHQVEVIGIDQDVEALDIARERLSRFGGRITFHHANFSRIGEIARSSRREDPDGIIADLGVSSLQLDSEARGFSFRFDSPLDMRMDADSGETVTEFLARIGEYELADIIYRFGEERASRKIAKWIVEKRESGTPITTTFELASLVRRAVRTSPNDRIHPATRTFQALRIAVNGELEILEKFIRDSVDLLRANGVLAIITFHSLEDRIVKQAFQHLAGRCRCPPRIPQCICGAMKKVEILTRKPIIATAAEQDKNPRSRSAKLRGCRKLRQ